MKPRTGNSCRLCDTARSTTGWSDDDGAACDDGAFCNGADTCSSGACSVHAGDPCGDDMQCDEASDTCVTTCAGCLIDGGCHEDGAHNPLNPCEMCNVAVSDTSWIADDGASCDDGLYCTGVDTCAGRSCEHSGDPCGESEACWEDEGGRCCSQAGTPACNSSDDAVLVDSCGHELSVVMECSQGCQDGVCLCDPVAGTGCPDGHKCTWADGRTGCFPDGDTGQGSACTLPGAGADDCLAGSYCLGGVCNEICTTSPNSCGEGSFCLVYGGLFTDQTDVGLCVAGCDPVAQDCSDPDLACYLQAVAGETICATVPDEAVGLQQDDPCLTSESDTCYLNGCDKGYGPLLPGGTCAFFCNPIDNWEGNVQGLAGDPGGITCEATFGGVRPDGPGPPYECVYIQTFYSDTGAVPDTIGMCVDPGTHGSCADFDWVQLQADIADGTANEAGYCDTICPACCMWHCISLATFEAGTRGN